MKPEINEIFIQRWISNELTEDELNYFKTTTEYKEYQEILHTSKTFKVPSYDSNKGLDKLKGKLNQTIKPEAKVISIKKWLPFVAAAASVVILVGIYNKGGNSTTSSKPQIENQIAMVSTSNNETKEVKLPDNSIVTLKGNSEVEYNKKTWSKNRNVKLKGNAFFKVEKGIDFVVETNTGSVSVLGTSFDVLTIDNKLFVACRTGKVKVENNFHTKIITPNQTVRIDSNRMNFIEEYKLGPHNEFYSEQVKIESTYLSELIPLLEKDFNVKFKIDKGVDLTEEYSTSYKTNNLNTALKVIFSTSNIKYEIIDNNIRLYVP